jgi:putative transposase
MSNDNLIELKKPAGNSDPLHELLRVKAREIIREAVEIELEVFLDEHRELRLPDGRHQVVRHGHHKERDILTALGPVTVRVPRVRDRGAASEEGKFNFESRLLPPYLRKSKCIEDLLPWLYLKGISARDFPEALEALLGPNAKGLSQGVVSRLKSVWLDEWKVWKKRDLSRKRYVYIWADGVYCKARMEDEKQCLLVIVGADETGKKELIAVEDGTRESKLSWSEVLLDLKERGLDQGFEVAVGDGALGFWAALREVYPATKEQRCWVHKTANLLNGLPKSQQPKAKERIHEIWMAATKEDATKAFDKFVEIYEAKYPKVAECLAKDRDELLTFYSFPAEHWRHIRTSNPIESTFSTVRLRSKRVRGCFSRETVITMSFKLMESAQKRWRRLYGYKRLADVIEGVNFVDGIPVQRMAA